MRWLKPRSAGHPDHSRRAKAAAPNRYYGSDGTIHGTEYLDVETRLGEVVAVWFRCQMLPFKQHRVSLERGDEMKTAGLLPAIVGVELARDPT